MADKDYAFPEGSFQRGMKLRDWFAGHIAAAAVGSGVPFEAKALARDSFMLADAMLAERERGK